MSGKYLNSDYQAVVQNFSLQPLALRMVLVGASPGYNEFTASVICSIIYRLRSQQDSSRSPRYSAAHPAPERKFVIETLCRGLAMPRRYPMITKSKRGILASWAVPTMCGYQNLGRQLAYKSKKESQPRSDFSKWDPLQAWTPQG